ncbi:MAG TPA: 3-hydroxyacyl-ACP dehydratase FabZ [Candidatus Latescibacteria bacterium]|nr:MAG: 3-hydroxyacyl-(acyl-carrier-protein) dehydratase FabZ [Candidatus Latescibacteria bacterium ADurb.Bin168]HPU85297.1 3-hydroxyacyl-ACP dehydratase FabZ [Candidatus Latescibacterota bacterium]
MSAAVNAPTVLDIRDIMDRIPHRYPFLLVDRIVGIREDGITGLKNVTINEPYFAGHWPSEPVMPGVLQLEALAQTGAVLLFHRLAADRHATKLDVFFRGIDGAKFRRIVRPGDQLLLDVGVLKQRRELFVLKGEARVNGEIASEAVLTAVLRVRGEEQP